MSRDDKHPAGNLPQSRCNDAGPGFATRAIHHGFDPAGFSNAVQPPVFLTSTYDPANLEAEGVGDDLVRLSVGLEDAEDIISDLQQGLEAL